MNENIKGKIFDIHRFALHDGPGIRTTVFLKGCPLHCLWCHNPESISPKPQLGYFAERCSSCGACMTVCPNQVHELNDGHHFLSREKCSACGLCVDVCPNNALAMTGKEMSTQRVMNIIIKDKTYYDESGGGITLSGGEPLMQPDFALSLLKRSKEAGIHTCVDTSGFASLEVLKKIVDYTDVFLFDYKVSDEKRHKDLTGKTNQCILSSFNFLYKTGCQIILRCPLIPGVNDSDDHFEAIARFEKDYPKLLKIQILPYHHIGHAKYERYGILNPLPLVTSAEVDTIQHWKAFFIKRGCRKIEF